MLEVSSYFYDAFDLTEIEEKELADGLIVIFEAYIKDRKHRFFGKDVPYHKPAGSVVSDVNLRHVHIQPLEPSHTELEKWRRFRTSDRCLVYARSSCKKYLLISYMHENAHAQAYDFDYIKALAKIGENWLYHNNIFADKEYPF
ncbi:type II toxin-antitoxin system YafO family toxin [Pseudomonas gingeri]|uniref:type II toxin-antitoxin system YafO family toxin n=1 Tax=Pseudomonas gingeri TaxID=117681 RepID=UPI0015A1F41B|nr:type II toxin-antitoxin system YafO family toxin [Pseudomonas gingeri]NWA09694.1 type II toxin-antitoxin system YafO family toxin [Pseudomonas gingeri]